MVNAIIKDEVKEEIFLERKVFSNQNHVYLYDTIDSVTVIQFIKEIEKAYGSIVSKNAEQVLKTNTISEPIWLHINSPGGTVIDSLALYDYIYNYHHPIMGIVEGIAASGASIVLCACTVRKMTKNSFILCHELSSYSGYRKYQSILDDQKNNTVLMKTIKDIYLKETAMTEDIIDEILSHDVYWGPKESLKYGIIDMVDGVDDLSDDEFIDIIEGRIDEREKRAEKDVEEYQKLRKELISKKIGNKEKTERARSPKSIGRNTTKRKK